MCLLGDQFTYTFAQTLRFVCNHPEGFWPVPDLYFELPFVHEYETKTLPWKLPKEMYPFFIRFLHNTKLIASKMIDNYTKVDKRVFTILLEQHRNTSDNIVTNGKS